MKEGQQGTHWAREDLPGQFEGRRAPYLADREPQGVGPDVCQAATQDAELLAGAHLLDVIYLLDGGLGLKVAHQGRVRVCGKDAHLQGGSSMMTGCPRWAPAFPVSRLQGLVVPVASPAKHQGMACAFVLTVSVIWAASVDQPASANLQLVQDEDIGSLQRFDDEIWHTSTSKRSLLNTACMMQAQ